MIGVRFDQQAAAAAVQALSDAAALLRSTTEARAGAARQALAGWTGPHADRFRGQDLRRLNDEASGIIRQLVTLQAAIEAAQAQASRDLARQSRGPGGRPLP
jgi:hypothetical protein